MLTYERLLAVLKYNKRTGIFTWRLGRNQVSAGDAAGSVDEGYIRIYIEGRSYRANRLAFLYVTGRWPLLDVDHKNRKRADNRWSNLREATDSQNKQNMVSPRRDNRYSNYVGVSWHTRDRKWRASIGLQGKRIYLGSFVAEEEARDAYLQAKRKYHTFAIDCISPPHVKPDAVTSVGVDNTTGRVRIIGAPHGR